MGQSAFGNRYWQGDDLQVDLTDPHAHLQLLTGLVRRLREMEEHLFSLLDRAQCLNLDEAVFDPAVAKCESAIASAAEEVASLTVVVRDCAACLLGDITEPGLHGSKLAMACEMIVDDIDRNGGVTREIASLLVDAGSAYARERPSQL